MKRLLLILCMMPTLSHAQKEYFTSYQQVADSLEKVFGIPSAVMLAIAYHESGGGKSRNAKLLNNHFGIVGSNDLKKTHKITSRYKQFSSVTESYSAFCRMIAKRAFYPGMRGSSDCSKWVTSISKSGYASSGAAWTEKIKWIIKHYGLE